MAIGLEAKGYRESETRAGKRHRNRQKVAKRDERAQELSHKASNAVFIEFRKLEDSHKVCEAGSNIHRVFINT
jgi:hypothetical protein